VKDFRNKGNNLKDEQMNYCTFLAYIALWSAYRSADRWGSVRYSNSSKGSPYRPLNTIHYRDKQIVNV